MSDERIAAALAGASLFGGIGGDLLAVLTGRSRVRRYRRNQPVFFEGDPSDAVLIVVSGRLKVVASSPDGDERLLDVVDVGESVGEIGVLDGGPRSATVEALEETEVVVVPADAVWECIDHSPAAARAVLRSLGATLRRITADASDLVFLDLPRRVAKVLLAELDTGSQTVTLGLSQTELGHRVGGTRQSVNAALRAFVRRRWIAVDGGQIVVRDAAALRSFVRT